MPTLTPPHRRAATATRDRGIIPGFILNYLIMRKYKVEKVYSDDLYYDLFQGGYIRPENILASPEEAQKVNDAIKVIEDFFNDLRADGILDDEEN